MPAFRPTLPSSSQGGPHPRARRRPHAAACAMCSGPRVQAQRCWDTDGAADGGGQQRAAGDGRSRAGTMGRDSPWFRGVRHTRYPLTARARDRRDERPEVTPHALPQGAEPRQARFTSRHRPHGGWEGAAFWVSERLPVTLERRGLDWGLAFCVGTY